MTPQKAFAKSRYVHEPTLRQKISLIQSLGLIIVYTANGLMVILLNVHTPILDFENQCYITYMTLMKDIVKFLSVSQFLVSHIYNRYNR